MWLFDFRIFYDAAQALLQGSSPYLVEGFYSPLPLALFFLPFALLPEIIAYALYLLLSAFLIWKLPKPQRYWALASFPVLFTFFVGQVDLQIALCAALLGPFALPFLLAKPQLGFVLLPWLLRDAKPRKLTKALLCTAGVLLLCFVIRPQWISEMLQAFPAMEEYSRRDSNLYWLMSHGSKALLIWIASPLALIVGYLFKERRDSWTVLHLFTPVSNIYSAAILFEWMGPIEALLSWLVIFAVGGDIHGGAPMFVVGLSILIRHSSKVQSCTKRMASKFRKRAS